jgi:hypothetical protein
MSIHTTSWIDNKLLQIAELRSAVVEETVGTPSYDPTDYERLMLQNVFDRADKLLRDLNRWKQHTK